MAISFDQYAPFDAGAGANVTEDTWRKMIIHAGKPSGVIRGYDLALQVFGDSSGLQVKCPTGQVWIQGHWGAVSSTKTIPLVAAHATLARKDLIVARADFVNNRVELDVLTGVPNASPNLTPVTQNSSICEIALAEVQVAAAATSIASGNVVDKRGFTTAVARYKKSASTQSINNDTDTKVICQTVQTFSGDIVPNATFDGFTLNRDGWWMMSGGLSWATGTTGYRQIGIGTTDGVTFVGRQKTSGSPDNNMINVTTHLQVVTGTSYSLWARHTQGSGLNLNNTEDGTWVAFTWIAY